MGRVRWPAPLRRDVHRIGLGISGDSIRAVVVRGRAPVWAIEASLAGEEALADQIARLLSRVPPAFTGWPRPRVVAAVGPAQVQAKRLNGLPPTTDLRVASALVREGANRFFMVGSEPVITSAAVIDESGEVWAAAFDRRIIDAIEIACRGANLPLTAILPSIVAIPTATADGTIAWHDGETCVEICAEGGDMRRVRRMPYCAATIAVSGDGSRDAAHPIVTLAALGDQAMGFADAYGAAAIGSERHRLVAPLQTDGGGKLVSRGRAALAIGICAGSLLAAALAPGLAAEHAGRTARAELGALRSARAQLHEAERNLALVNGALGEVVKARSGFRSPLAFLGQLTMVLPDQSAIVALRLDSLSGTVVALTPRAAALVNRLDTIPSIVGPEIIGPVTREMVSGRELERVTIRFGLSAAGRP